MEMAARRRSVGEILGEIAQDRDYYRDSGGGVTLSGGEVFCQPGFAEALIDGCRAAGFPVAVETNLAYPFEPVRPILEKTDLIMFDLKLFDSEAHRKWTGSGNGQILENARRLEELEIPLIARTPLVPGVTDSEENIEAIAGFLAGFRRLRCYELLNFNPLGDPKYRALGRENPFREARPLPPERVETLRRLAAGRNLVVKAG